VTNGVNGSASFGFEKGERDSIAAESILGEGKYIPAEPGALVCEPLEAAIRGR
jgi:hypothetical protein